MKKQLGELRFLYLYASAICGSQAFGDVLTDLDIEDLASKALKTIDENCGDELANTIKRKNEIQRKIYQTLSESNEVVQSDEFNAALNEDKDFQAVIERENKLLEKEVDFEFEPIEIAIEKGVKLDFPETVPVNFKGEELNIIPYPSFRQLLSIGYLKIKK